jgi:hypothetical protein
VNEFRQKFFEAHKIFSLADFIDGGVVVLKPQDKAGIDYEYIKSVAHEQYLHNMCVLKMVCKDTSKREGNKGKEEKIRLRGGVETQTRLSVSHEQYLHNMCVLIITQQ